MINDICDYSRCTGCSACASICPKQCIKMMPDDEGFPRPVIDHDLCIECMTCEKTCPINNQVSDSKRPPTTFAARHKSPDILHESSSGGAFTALASLMLKEDGVVFGAGFDEEFRVIHKECRLTETLDELRKSKYVQSSIGDTYIKAKKALAAGRKVLFCGTPCQIAGLKAFLGGDHENLFTVDFICHGVPSPKAWKKYLEFREKIADSGAEQVFFRSKDKGWKKYSLKILFKNHTLYTKEVAADMYLRSFIMNMDLRPSCYNCAFKKIHRVSEITLADFWGINRENSELSEWNDDTGVSCVMVHNEKGQKLLNDAESDLHLKLLDFNKAIRSNPSMTKSVSEPPLRKRFMKDLDELPFDELHEKYCSSAIPSRIRRKFARIIQEYH